MTTEFVTVGQGATRGEVVDHIRFQETLQISSIIIVLDTEASLPARYPGAPRARQSGEKMQANFAPSPTFGYRPTPSERTFSSYSTNTTCASLAVVDRKEPSHRRDHRG